MVFTVIDPEYVLTQLSSEEKIALLSGDDMWHTVPIPRLGVPRVRCSDGPVSDKHWTYLLLVHGDRTDCRMACVVQPGPMERLRAVSLLRRVWQLPLTSIIYIE